MSLVAQHVLVSFSYFITVYWLYIWLTNEKIVINVSIYIHIMYYMYTEEPFSSTLS